ncbi:hypothetical protein BV898_12887 [Hypsibius exemplaris]|uniref:Uncharacterized protein n=1 Tax=Hypsibius exemplaris TaxID=2072580 RepID=A0A1W0WCG1_HYPEX|nr:hypothetical protein BV898_12887 [Hypsibius exemplaris]
MLMERNFSHFREVAGVEDELTTGDGTVAAATATSIHFSLGKKVTLYGTLQYATIRYGTLRYATVRYGTLRYATVRYGTLRYDTVRYGTLRYATVRYGTLRYATKPWPWTKDRLPVAARSFYQRLKQINSCLRPEAFRIVTAVDPEQTEDF